MVLCGINIRILHSGLNAQDKGDSRNNGWQDSYVCCVGLLDYVLAVVVHAS